MSSCSPEVPIRLASSEAVPFLSLPRSERTSPKHMTHIRSVAALRSFSRAGTWLVLIKVCYMCEGTTYGSGLSLVCFTEEWAGSHSVSRQGSLFGSRALASVSSPMLPQTDSLI